MYSVSVIMPVYNNEQTLRQAIETILNQTLYDVEIILINDGSTDSSGEICDEYEKMEPLLVEVIHQPRLGFVVARNKGLRRARGRYIYFANASHFYDKRMLETNVKLADEKQAELVVFGFTNQSEEDALEKVTHIPNLPNLPNQERFRIHYRNFHNYFPYNLCNKLYRRDYIVENRIFFSKQPLKEYAFFNLQVYKKINSVVFNRAAFCTHDTFKQPEQVGFQEHLFETNMKLASHFQYLMEFWDEADEFEDLIIAEYYRAILDEIENVCKKEAGFSLAEQQEYISAILRDERISPYLEKFKMVLEKTPYNLALMTAFQNGNGKVAVQLYNKRNETKETTSKIKSLFNRIFNKN